MKKNSGHFKGGSANPRWNNGRTINSKGYALIFMPEHPRADIKGYVYEHLLVMEEFLGRPLTMAETVHHLDGNKSNNALGNLVLFATKGMHTKFHQWLRKQEKLMA